MHLRAFLAAGAALALTSCVALNNGVGPTPQMGFNSWYALHNHLTYPNYTWEPGYVMSDDMLAIGQWLTQHGFQALGFDTLNTDDCIVVGRDANGNLVPDPQAFPRGWKAYTDAVHALGYKAGVYGDRGNQTCSCWAGGLKRPGQKGHEFQDAAFYAESGFDELKEDSCFDSSPNTNATLQEYALMRDGLNATGRPILFDICWVDGPAVAPEGRSLGNEWRVDEDDGSGWAAILQNVYTAAGLGAYAGCENTHGPDGLGCGFNDPGLLLVGGAGLSDVQGRSHMGLWAVLASKLLVSVDPRTFSAASIATLTNAEVIAIDQDSLAVQGVRIVPPADAARTLRDAALRRAFFARPENAHIPRRAKYGVVAQRAGALPPGAPAGRGDVVVPGTEAAEVAAAGGRVEVWGRALQGQDVALLLFNNGLPQPATIACTGACFAALPLPPGTASVSIRDVWARTDNGTATATAGITVAGIPTNATVLLRLTPRLDAGDGAAPQLSYSFGA